VELAAKYFDIHALPRFIVHLEDAAVFIRNCKTRYDLIIVDTYLQDRLPDQCTSLEFLRDVRRCLMDSGVLVFNWLNDDPHTKRTLLTNIESTVGPVWCLSGLNSRNLLYLATTRLIEHPELVATAARIEDEIPFVCSLKRIVQRLRKPQKQSYLESNPQLLNRSL
jgi:spermidine synthase